MNNLINKKLKSIVRYFNLVYDYELKIKMQNFKINFFILGKF